MKQSRRNFLKTSGIVAGTGLLLGGACNEAAVSQKNNTQAMQPKGYKTGKINLSYKSYDLQLKHVFTIAKSSRTHTPTSIVKLELDGVTGIGEGAMPPYLGESHETAKKFIEKVDLTQFNDPFRMEEILDYVDSLAPKNAAIKSAIDIALHDLVGKLIGLPWFRIWGYNQEDTPNTSFTIGIDKPEVVKEKTQEAKGFKILKVKLGRGNDKEMINTIRTVTDVPLCVDVNQGWAVKEEALEMANWLKEQGIVFIEQPMPKEQIDDIAWLSDNSPLPIVADESLQRLADLPKLFGVYSGINIKLAKCTGLREAHKMLNVARGFGMKVMIGCMTETSCAISAASQLSPMVDWADLDGNLLISNDIFEGVTVNEGKITLNEKPGIGIKEIEKKA